MTDGLPPISQGSSTVPRTPEWVPVGFARALRERGLPVPLDAVVSYGRALVAVGFERQAWTYWAGRSTLVSTVDDVPVYDEVFSSFWFSESPDHAGRSSERDELPATGLQGPEGRPLGRDEAGDEADGPLTVSFSAREVLRQKDFAQCTPDELQEAYRAMSSLRVRADLRRSRRWHRSHSGFGRPDVHRTLRQAMRNGGELGRLHRRRRVAKPRRVVLLCDISGSMGVYTRVLLRFLHVAVVGRGHTEAFALGTRLTRLTSALNVRDPDAAMAAAASAVADWSGGTRIGESIRAFNDRFGVRGMARGAVVVILSDGWDMGEPAVLASELARLGRVASRIVWANPWKATDGYAPITRGMTAALPHIDRFVGATSLASLDELVDVIATG